MLLTQTKRTRFKAVTCTGPKGRKQLFDPILLNPVRSDEARKRVRPDSFKAELDPDIGAWTAPFLMATVNSRVVRRSAALAALDGQSYGDDFDYGESLVTSSRRKATALAMGLNAGLSMLNYDAGRRVIRALGPKPGQGPSQRAIDTGFFRARFVARTSSGKRVQASFSAQGDANNKSTVTMLGEAALSLALDADALPGGAARHSCWR